MELRHPGQPSDSFSSYSNNETTSQIIVNISVKEHAIKHKLMPPKFLVIALATPLEEI